MLYGFLITVKIEMPNGMSTSLKHFNSAANKKYRTLFSHSGSGIKKSDSALPPPVLMKDLNVLTAAIGRNMNAL